MRDVVGQKTPWRLNNSTVATVGQRVVARAEPPQAARVTSTV
jgi:hypothetical protein